eukprot:TRINITY_DN3102_c0_g1_i2.p1 TRINITY_DN3102_c0_g1~~TRINITY_DN3102_c0_g1_i2.p1  ORF type:complete len:465 (+),score=166.23 TRINITY_DN3102_c0_g1_i2:203-1396(+)
MTVKDLSLMVRHDFGQKEKYNIAFLLQKSVNDAAATRVEEDSSKGCFHETQKTESDFLFSMESRTEWKIHEVKQEIKEPGLYHLYFSNCEKDTQVSFTMSLTEYNVDQFGNRVYLSAGEASLPTWFFIICCLFVVALICWTVYLTRHREELKNIHHLMTAVLVCKILNLLFEAFKYHSIKATGTTHGWNIPFHIFSFLKGMLLFTVVILIGTGWSYMKPFLTDRDKKIIWGVLVLQVLVNIAMVVLDEEAPGAYGWITWRDILHLLDMICCCAILFPIVWSIRHLKDASDVDGKAARNLEKLKRFRKFYLLVVSYIYFTRIIVFLLGATLPFDQYWIGVVISEMASLFFFSVTGYLFRPLAHNPYLPVDSDEHEEDDGNDLEMERVQMSNSQNSSRD